MEHQTGREERIPGEIVETYRQRRLWDEMPGETVLPPSSGPDRPVRHRRRRRRRRRGLWAALLLLALLLGLLGGTLLSGWLQPRRQPYGYDEYWVEETESLPITIPTYPFGEGAVLEVESEHGPALTAQEIYRLVNPSVVSVIVQMEDGAALGTGVIFSEDGYILTNYHVLEGGTDCSVTLESGRTYQAQYVAGEERNDLAVLKVHLTGLPAAQFGDSSALVVGDPVYAIGNPLGMELRGTLTDGIVSAINRDVWVDGWTMNLIQTNAALNSGNSGGPLINAYGQVVGINTIKMSSAYDSVEGLGFAIPSASLRVLVNDLLTYGQIRPEPEIGVTVSELGTQLSEDLWGIEVLSVTEGSAADDAGVRTGDFILAANGEAVSGSKDLLRIRRQFQVGEELPLTLWRDGREVEVTLLLREAVSEG